MVLSAQPAGSEHTRVYDLRGGEATSDFFYDLLAEYADQVLVHIEAAAADLLDGYGAHLRTERLEAPRSRAELAIDLLMLGMAMRQYEGAAESTPRVLVRLAGALYRLRKRSTLLKPVADALRAVLAQVVFAPAITRHRAAVRADAALARVTRTVTWMQATGEFDQETLRLAHWQSFLATLAPAAATRARALAQLCFRTFELEAAERLGSFTAGVTSFLSGAYARRGCREDRIFCGRRPVEYHLNMVAAEVMNRGLHEGFARTGRRAVLVPACMRGQNAEHCRARIRGVDRTCTGCDPACTVNRITRTLRAHGADVYLVPHSSSFSRWLDRWEREPGVGVTAVACLLNILPGGYEMRSRAIPSQCVPLDFPGCRRHWDAAGIPTAVNEDRLVRIATAGQA